MQLTLPIYPAGSILISDRLGAFSHDKIVQYIAGGLPVHQHAEEDINSFRFAISNFIKLGGCKKAFQVINNLNCCQKLSFYMFKQGIM